ncbi:MAG: gliding motility-associated protein GldE [Muribaculaceae bacterium]|nr:gliding motility-associated protein GldE [Muribaculaceae bacterium]
MVISGVVSGSEISFFSLDSADLEELEESHPTKGEQITGIMSKPEKFLATILIANNLVNITIVIILSYALSPLFEGMPDWAEFVLQTVLLTFLILLFGEIIPKLYANNNPKGWALNSLPGINALLAIFSPLSSLLVKSNWLVNKVVTRRAEKISTDELSQALELTSIQEGEQKDMLEGILKFGDTTASEIMTPRVDITDISIATPFDKVMEIVIESGYARIPVYENTQDDIKGILYSRDLLPYVDKLDPNFEWQKLIRKPYFVPESRQIDDLLEDFRKLKIHLAIVIDEYGGTQGIVTLEDVLEEIVGDIDDEYDDEEKTYKRLADNTYIFEGKTLLTDFFRITEQDPELYEPVAADCETLAGMLLAIKGDFPKEKEPLVYGRCRFLVLDVEHHRITSVRVKVMDENQHM